MWYNRRMERVLANQLEGFLGKEVMVEGWVNSVATTGD